MTDDLPMLVMGEVTRSEVIWAARHLRQCTDCRLELIAIVTAHGLLRSTSDVVRSTGDGGEPTAQLRNLFDAQPPSDPSG